MIRYIIIIIIMIIIIICDHCLNSRFNLLVFFIQGPNLKGGVGQSLGGSLGCHGGDAVLLEVGGHRGVAGQSLTGAF